MIPPHAVKRKNDLQDGGALSLQATTGGVLLRLAGLPRSAVRQTTALGPDHESLPVNLQDRDTGFRLTGDPAESPDRFRLKDREPAESLRSARHHRAPGEQQPGEDR